MVTYMRDFMHITCLHQNLSLDFKILVYFKNKRLLFILEYGEEYMSV